MNLTEREQLMYKLVAADRDFTDGNTQAAFTNLMRVTLALIDEVYDTQQKLDRTDKSKPAQTIEPFEQINHMRERFYSGKTADQNHAFDELLAFTRSLIENEHSGDAATKLLGATDELLTHFENGKYRYAFSQLRLLAQKLTGTLPETSENEALRLIPPAIEKCRTHFEYGNHTTAINDLKFLTEQLILRHTEGQQKTIYMQGVKDCYEDFVKSLSQQEPQIKVMRYAYSEIENLAYDLIEENTLDTSLLPETDVTANSRSLFEKGHVLSALHEMQTIADSQIEQHPSTYQRALLANGFAQFADALKASIRDTATVTPDQRDIFTEMERFVKELFTTTDQVAESDNRNQLQPELGEIHRAFYTGDPFHAFDRTLTIARALGKSQLLGVEQEHFQHKLETLSEWFQNGQRRYAFTRLMTIAWEMVQKEPFANPITARDNEILTTCIEDDRERFGGSSAMSAFMSLKRLTATLIENHTSGNYQRELEQDMNQLYADFMNAYKLGDSRGAQTKAYDELEALTKALLTELTVEFTPTI